VVRLSDLPPNEARPLAELPCPTFETSPWVSGPPLRERRVAIVSTAGLHRLGEPPFAEGATSYRVIPGRVKASELIMSHISANFDRTGFFRDLNVLFPLDRLRELAREGLIGSVAEFHYSFMGATNPLEMESAARQVAGLLRGDEVNAVLLLPV